MQVSGQSTDVRLPVRLPVKRASLTIQQVLQIFASRMPPAEVADPSKQLTFTAKSKEISRQFGVSPKAVRDIWNRRTWCVVTSTMFPQSELVEHASAEGFAAVRGVADLYFAMQRSRGGRPRGSKDSKPRKRRYPLNLNELDFAADRHRVGLAQRQAAECAFPEMNHLRCDAVKSSAVPSDQPANEKQHYWINTKHEAMHQDEECSLLRTYPFFLQF